MLPKQERLKDRHLFNLAFNVGQKKKQKIHSNLLSLYYLYKKKDINRFPNEQNLPKAAFVVGTRIDKKANKRNLIKRRMRAAYRLVTKKLYNSPVNKPFALIWISNPAIKNATFDQIRNSMEVMLRKLVL